jgi:hypothetical protein
MPQYTFHHFRENSTQKWKQGPGYFTTSGRAKGDRVLQPFTTVKGADYEHELNNSLIGKASKARRQ